jgi:hypothetical protein
MRIAKNRSRTTEHPTFGGYMIIDNTRNYVVAGGTPSAYMLSLEDVEEYFKSAT